jgi:hypothetical protein
VAIRVKVVGLIAAIALVLVEAMLVVVGWIALSRLLHMNDNHAPLLLAGVHALGMIAGIAFGMAVLVCSGLLLERAARGRGAPAARNYRERRP